MWFWCVATFVSKCLGKIVADEKGQQQPSSTSPGSSVTPAHVECAKLNHPIETPYAPFERAPKIRHNGVDAYLFCRLTPDIRCRGGLGESASTSGERISELYCSRLVPCSAGRGVGPKFARGASAPSSRRVPLQSTAGCSSCRLLLSYQKPLGFSRRRRRRRRRRRWSAGLP